MAPKIKLSLNTGTDSVCKSALKTAAGRKKGSLETLEEAWARIEAMKNTPAEVRMISEVKAALEAGKVGREPTAVARGRRLSKAEVKLIYPEVKSIIQQEILADMVDNMPSNYWLIQTEEQFNKLLSLLEKEEIMIFDVETTGTNVYQDYLVGHVVGCYSADIHAYIPVRHDTDETQLNAEYVAEKLKPFYEDKRLRKVAHNGGFDKAILANDLGIQLENLWFDTMPAMVILNENEASFVLKNLATAYLKIPSLTYKELFGNKGFNEVSDLKVAGAYAIKDSDLTMRLMNFQHKHLKRFPSLEKYFFEVEMPFVSTILDTESTGFKIDEAYAAEYAERLKNEIGTLENELVEAFDGININSPAQLKPELEKLTGTKLESVDAKKVLKPLAGQFPLIQKYLKFKGDAKLYSTYISVLPKLVEEKTGRLHPSYRANGAKTGRLSSSGGFNAQNLPAEARKIIVAPENKVIVGLDFGNQEGRIAAAKVQEPFLLDAFREGKDPYIALATIAYHKDYDEIDKDSVERKRAKTGFLAYIYGTGDRTMGEQLGISKDEAHELKEKLGQQMPRLKKWAQEQRQFVKRNGFVWIGKECRKRRLPDALKGDYRPLLQSTNAPIQGEAAIQTKITMNKMCEMLAEWRQNGRDFKQLATVHDEILVEAPLDITEHERGMLVNVMTQSYLLDGVENESDVEIYMERWGEAVRWQEFIEKRGY
ncbi:DNA polymerase [Listeria monocytogenes]|uniref:DNA polymerase n=1 Tax=Listeria monocytogenes TaxID=1639 RepID=UPI001F1FDD8B|nr:DNA polymerase [Listeria monocytogenes]UIJ49780.1 DNA polymerase [Listeria monocytogenes]